MAILNEQEQARRRLRAAMSMAAALCVLGFASLVWLHNASQATVPGTGGPAAIGDAYDAVAPDTTSSGVPSADSVFRNAGYVAPEEPIAQF